MTEHTNNYPLVSVGIPAYNSRDSIMEAVNSVLEQDYPNLEIIISDDHSTDNTPELCRSLQERYPFIRYIRQPENIGLVRNFEFVKREASGNLFMWVAHDDAMEPGILKKYVEFLLANPSYTLVSGQIRYLSGNEDVYCEKGFSREQSSPGMRVLLYYSRVIQGAMYYGLMRKETAEIIPLRNRIGDDWHFVASLAYLGRIKNLDCIGYNKKLGGTSKTFEQYARVIGASRFSAKFPYITIAVDAFREIISSPVYKEKRIPSRFILATSCCAAILFNYYVRHYPFVVGGRIKRLLRLHNINKSSVSAKKVGEFPASLFFW